MKILVSSINFLPDHSGIALYAADLPIFFAAAGEEVTMVTGFSYYPRWLKKPEDVGVLFRRETCEGVQVLRGYLYVPRRVTTAKRFIHDLSFLGFAFLNFCRAGRHDLIVVLTPPFLLGLIGLFFKKIWKAKLVVHIQDFQLDAALSLGMMSKSILIKFLERMDRYIYRKCDLVVPITRGMQEWVFDKGINAEKTLVVYNWIDVKETSELGQEGEFINNYPELKDKFKIAYAGNIGIKQGVDTLINLAEATKDNNDVHYFIIGEGADKPRLEAIAAQKRLANVTFMPFLNQEQYFNMLRDIDLPFVAQKANTGNVFFPSKLLGLMAQAKPVLLSADLDSELARFVSSHGTGLVAPAGDVETLKKQVDYLYAHPEELRLMGQKGLRTVQQFDRGKVLSGYLARLTELVRVTTLPLASHAEPPRRARLPEMNAAIRNGG